MRKIIVMAMLAIVSSITMAQGDKEAKAPTDVTEAFSMLYPNVKDVVWKNKQADFEANFEQNEKVVSLLFDKNGILKEVKNEIKESELPANVNTSFAKEFPDWKIRKATRIDVRGAFNYEVVVEKDEERIYLIFNTRGMLLKKSADRNDDVLSYN